MSLIKKHFLVFTVIYIGWHSATPFVVAAEPFQDVTANVGLSGLAIDVGSWGDFNNDGWVDLFVGGQLWRNEKGERFTRVEGTPLLGSGIWGDYDNDGFLDLFVWTAGGRLFKNLDGKSFDDMSERFPRLPIQISLGATWGDFDGDGFLDLYVGGYEIEGKG